MLTRPARDLARRIALALVVLPQFVFPALANAQPGGGEPAAANAAAAPVSPPFFERSDLGFAAVSVAAIALVAPHDAALRRDAITEHTPFARDLARAAQPLGNVAVVGPALLAGYGLARVLHAPVAAAGLTEAGLSVLAAGVGALAVKEAVGRARPHESPGDSHVFRPFSGHASFPSGHAAVAFALAESVDLQWHSRWAPWVTLPLAGLVGWSRVRDDEHWTSDVVAGAALGVWTARKVHRMLPAEKRWLSRFGVSVAFPGGAPGLAFTLR